MLSPWSGSHAPGQRWGPPSTFSLGDHVCLGRDSMLFMWDHSQPWYPTTPPYTTKIKRAWKQSSCPLQLTFSNFQKCPTSGPQPSVQTRARPGLDWPRPAPPYQIQPTVQHPPLSCGAKPIITRWGFPFVPVSSQTGEERDNFRKMSSSMETVTGSHPGSQLAVNWA